MVGAIAGQLAAQHGGTGHPGGGAHFAGGHHYPEGVVVPPVGDVVPGLGPSTLSWHDRSSRGWGANRWGNSGSNYGYAGYGPDYGYDYAFDPFYANRDVEPNPAPQPGLVVLMPQVEALPPPPPPPIRPETREYTWPAAETDSSATFSIVSKDGQVQSATAVWVQDQTLCFFTPDGNKGRMAIESVDRQATRQRNAEKQLSLWLPPEG
jgi:hypothetical protein